MAIGDDTHMRTECNATQQRDDGECPKYFTSVSTNWSGQWTHIHIRGIISSNREWDVSMNADDDDDGPFLF